MKYIARLTAAFGGILLMGLAGPASAAFLDGTAIPSEGLTLRATQDTPTGFGNATAGGQDSAGGSELNQMFADIDGDTLRLAITGNLEANFNKFFIFFDAVAGGEATLLNDNADGGSGEINAMEGLSFGGPTMDHFLRLEVGGGFLGVRYGDLIDNTGGDIFTDGVNGVAALPLSNVVGAQGVTFGWDNSNILGVDGVSAAGASTATTGFGFEIDMPTFFGESPVAVNVAAVVTNGGSDFLSNQLLPGIGGGGNIGSANGATIGTVTVPEPSAIALFMLGLAATCCGRRQR